MPAPLAIFRLDGMARASHCLSPRIDRATKIRPSINTAVSAIRYETGPVPCNPTT